MKQELTLMKKIIVQKLKPNSKWLIGLNKLMENNTLKLSKNLPMMKNLLLKIKKKKKILTQDLYLTLLWFSLALC
jgi:hypothetical protein